VELNTVEAVANLAIDRLFVKRQGAAATVVEWTSWVQDAAEPRKVATEPALGAKGKCAKLAWMVGVGTHLFPKRNGRRQPTTLRRRKEKGNHRGVEAVTGGGTENGCFSFFEAKSGPGTAQNGRHTIRTMG
jgi:hypothetical protein